MCCSGGEQETAIDSSQQLHSDDSKHDNLQEHELQAKKEDNQQKHQQAGFRDNYELPLSKQRSAVRHVKSM